MKKVYQKIIASIFGTVLFIGTVLPVNNVSASQASFNNDPEDFPTVKISNYTKNPGCSSCWSNSVSADAGDEVSFQVYYHNTGNATAKNTKAKVSLPSGSFTNNTITGMVWADNASQVSDSVSLNLSSSQSISYVSGSLRWYPNQSYSTSPLPFGQNGNEIVDSGFNIGSIAAGWNTQGLLIFRVKVSDNGSSSSVSVNTNSATSVAQNSATLQGSLNSGNASADYWFEYGTSNSFGYSTNRRSMNTGNGNSSISEYISGLQSNATYYYRAVAENQNGNKVYGSTLSFTTNNSNNNGSTPSVTTYSAFNINQRNATLEASVNPNGSSTTVWFEYGTSNSFGYSTNRQSINSGNSYVSSEQYISGLQSNQTYYYRAVAENNYGTVRGSTLSFTTNQGDDGSQSAPIVSTFSAINIYQNSALIKGSVNPNGSNTNAWFEYGTSQNLGYTIGYQNIGSYDSGSSINYTLTGLSANTVYYYRVVAQNNYGINYGSILSFNTNGSSNQNTSAPVVATIDATSVYQNVALINGTVNPNNGLTTAWFEWGRTAALGSTTNSQPIGSGYGTFNTSYALTGLSSGTTYFFRVVAQNSYGTQYGSIISFVTKSPVYVPTTPIVIDNTPTKINGILLVGAVDNNNPQKGDELVYTLTYKNTTSRPINNAVIKIILPSETVYKNANVVPSLISANSLNFNLGTLNADSEGAISIRMSIKNTVKEGSALVFSGILEYTNYQGKFLSASNYLTVLTNQGVSLGTASLLDAFRSLLGNWLFYVILLIALAVFLYTYIKGKAKPKYPNLPTA